MTARGLERKPRVPETVAVRSIVGKCGSFDAGFLPVCSWSAERWKRVYEAFLEGKPLPPVELYKVGGVYFIVDGNHRVSVARYRGRWPWTPSLPSSRDRRMGKPLFTRTRKAGYLPRSIT